VHEASALKDRAIEEAKTSGPQDTQVWKSIFASLTIVRILQSFAGNSFNVFLHLHPAKINRDAVRYRLRGEWAESLFTYS
jgi:hypothetical protein